MVPPPALPPDLLHAVPRSTSASTAAPRAYLRYIRNGSSPLPGVPIPRDVGAADDTSDGNDGGVGSGARPRARGQAALEDTETHLGDDGERRHQERARDKHPVVVLRE